MTRDEAIQALNEIFDDSEFSRYESWYGTAMGMAIEALSAEAVSEDTQTEERARFVAKEAELAHIEARLENAEKRLQSMNKSQEDFETLCICALRYCHGRISYMPSLVQEIVGKHLEEFSDKTIKVMVDDCQFQRNMDLYGDECDKVDWLKWEQKVKGEQTRRTIDESRVEE